MSSLASVLSSAWFSVMCSVQWVTVTYDRVSQVISARHTVVIRCEGINQQAGKYSQNFKPNERFWTILSPGLILKSRQKTQMSLSQSAPIFPAGKSRAAQCAKKSGFL